MATYIKTLKEDNGDTVYPQTITNAIYTSGGETLETKISKYVTAEDIAQSVASFGTVTTGMIDNSAITTAKINDGSVTASKIDTNAVTTSKIDDGAVTADKIDWTSLTDNQNNIRKIYKYNFTGSTDANGFLYIPNTVVKPATGAILGARCTNKNCFTSVYSDSSSDRFTVRCDQYNWAALANTSNVTVDIYYILDPSS